MFSMGCGRVANTASHVGNACAKERSPESWRILFSSNERSNGMPGGGGGLGGEREGKKTSRPLR